MAKWLCYIYENMADFEIALTLHCLHDIGKFDIITVSENKERITAQSGMKYIPDKKISELEETFLEECVGLLIPGGPINQEQNEICPVIQAMEKKGKTIAALCFAPQFLGRAGILENHRFTTTVNRQYIEKIGSKDPFCWENYEEKRLVMDRNILTAKGLAFVDMAEKISELSHVFATDDERTAYFNEIRKNYPD